MGMLSDFKNFVLRGNVVDMAVGVVIGAAFGKIVTSLVGDIITPPLGLLQDGVPFKDAAFALTDKPDGAAIRYGAFIQVIIDFLIVAVALFALITIIQKAQSFFAKKKEAEKAADPPEEIVLLREIRDSLNKAPKV